MSGDYSRKRFEVRRGYSGVLMQQGRVQLDSDWNEQIEIEDRRLRAETIDIIGRCVVPWSTPMGFKVEWDGSKLSIGQGRIYVDGLLAENHGGGAVEFDSLLAELRGTESRALDEQPFQPQSTEIPPSGTFLIYVDVWQREITALEAPEIVETAVGVDTTTRLQTAWQVKLLPKDVGNVECKTPDEQVPGWADVTRPSGGRLTTSIESTPTEIGPCILPPGSGFRGLDNRLYRVEIHSARTNETATFKWSRDNASVAASVVAIENNATIKVDRLGRDAEMRFKSGDWIEITDDVRELSGKSGLMRKIASVDPSLRSIVLVENIPAGEFPAIVDEIQQRHTRIIRWDQSGGEVEANGGLNKIPTDNTAVTLEDGIQVTFSLDSATGRYLVGDYWVFCARTNNREIEKLDRAPPRGVHHHFGRLALFSVAGGVQDCRVLWPQRHLALRYVSGDGQEGPPGEKVACPLVVGVEDEHARPQAGIAVRFSDQGAGDVLNELGTPANSGSTIVVMTNASGLAHVERLLNKKPGCHDVLAQLDTPPPQGSALPVRFEATVRQDNPSPQQLPTIVSLRYLVGKPFVNDEPVPLDIFNRGLAFEFSDPMSPLTLQTRNPNVPPIANPNTIIFTLELPQQETAGQVSIGGHRLFVVSGQVDVIDGEGRVWAFTPTPPIPKEVMQSWIALENKLFDSRFVRCRIALKSNFILDLKGRPLDGDAFLRWNDKNQNGLQDRDELALDDFGDGRKGGDFGAWFWLS